MKKMIIALSALLYIFTIPVFASEEDILKEPVKEEEGLLEEENLLKGTGNTNGVKSNVTSWDQANIIAVIYNGTTSYTRNVNLSNVSSGDKFYIFYYYNDNINGFLCDQNGNKFLFEYGVTNWSGTVYINGTYSTYRLRDDTLSTSPNNYIEIYQEPTPEPTSTPEPTPTPEPEDPEIDPETISGNEILREILRTNRSILQNVENINEFISNNSVSGNNVSNNAVSDNIIHKKLEDYNTSESLALIGLVLAFGALLVYVIHKSVFKIRR